LALASSVLLALGRPRDAARCVCVVCLGVCWCVCVSLFFGNRALGCNKMFVCSMCGSVLVCVCTCRRAFSFLALASSDYVALERPRDVVRCECAVCWCVCEVCLGVYILCTCVCGRFWR